MRNHTHVVDESSERHWFQRKVIAKASKQIRDSLRYLGEYEKIHVTNELGHKFDIAQSQFTEVLKLIVYLPGLYLPEDCRNVKHYVSETAGFIHVINARDYLEICRTLRLPADILSYLSYRQRVLENYGQEIGRLPEPLFMGQFLSTITDVPPTKESHAYLEAFLQDVESFDLTGLIGSLHHHIEKSENPYEYYQIIQEFAKLPRSMWREIKTRFMLCLEKTKKGEFTLPYRMAFPATDCGFVLIPVDSRIVADPNWATLRVNGVLMLAHANKYDQKLGKCVGISVAKEGEEYLIDWCLLDFPWAYDPELEQKLADSFPFREVTEREFDSFRFN